MNDFRFAFRQLLKSPAFTIVAVVRQIMVALGNSDLGEGTIAAVMREQ